MDGSKIIIGRRDRIDLPELGYTGIRAKIDTGAFGSVIHCSHIEVIRKSNQDVLSVVFLDSSYSDYKGKPIYFEQYRDKLVKNSSGESEHRYFIFTDILIFGKRIITEFSLTDRSQMKYPVLLGRKFLRQGFLVDVNRKNLSCKQKQTLSLNSPIKSIK
ncbi:MAG: RimK/LysX family protein [Bacteroidales bacterium]|nr:RimK/LysX family protein [Bacteroidales bacterium]